ncbi:MAG: ATP-binding cassette domain-containing protein, partial [Actinomycetota bacterium]
MTSLALHGLRITRAGTEILHSVDLQVEPGERVVVLGPSGAGKTILLRAIAGLETVEAGRVVVRGRDVTQAPPRERELAIVNQQSGLLSHLDVEHNLRFPLEVGDVGDAEVQRRVRAEAGAFSLFELLPRRPRTLATGARDEVALARSLVRQVAVLLLDEPFSGIDPPRRRHLLRELIEVQEGEGAALLAATNDQDVMLALAHRCAILVDGQVVQVAPPVELFGGVAGARAAFVAMALLPGPPLLYNGQEVESPQRLPLFEREPVEWEQSNAGEARAFYRQVIDLSKRHPAFAAGDLRLVYTDTEDDVIAYSRDHVAVLVNVRDRPIT